MKNSRSNQTPPTSCAWTKGTPAEKELLVFQGRGKRALRKLQGVFDDWAMVFDEDKARFMGSGPDITGYRDPLNFGPVRMYDNKNKRVYHLQLDDNGVTNIYLVRILL